MGLLDAIFGRKRMPPSVSEKLGTIASAELAVRTLLQAEPSGRAALAVRSVEASQFERAREQIDGMVKAAGESLGSTASIETDEHGFLWVVVSDEDFSDLVAAMQIATQVVIEEGFRDQLLCAVFAFDGPLYLVYSFKRGVYYAFAPRGAGHRDVAAELRAHSLLAGELPLEKDMAYRYPLWGIPL